MPSLARQGGHIKESFRLVLDRILTDFAEPGKTEANENENQNHQNNGNNAQYQAGSSHAFTFLSTVAAVYLTHTSGAEDNGKYRTNQEGIY